ncbi:hypothetical protein QYF61_005790 [Mycteria americana]|uniref:Uncharacterized protein n=1 Tax=Mycteria americana TaxID=33587 RepID=A0AAN7RUU5_MYCAM|nr:hypothetical protein QYF61_005790 [Mycteria americana]
MLVPEPKMLVSFSFCLMEDRIISLTGCPVQINFMVLLGTVECLLLAALTYDLHMAISGLLKYKLIMNRELCTTSGKNCSCEFEDSSKCANFKGNAMKEEKSAKKEMKLYA